MLIDWQHYIPILRPDKKKINLHYHIENATEQEGIEAWTLIPKLIGHELRPKKLVIGTIQRE